METLAPPLAEEASKPARPDERRRSMVPTCLRVCVFEIVRDMLKWRSASVAVVLGERRLKEMASACSEPHK